MKALRGFNSCLERQVNEAVRVTGSQADVILNSKNEFHQAPIMRVIVASGLHGEQGESQDPTITSRAGPRLGRGQGRPGTRGAGRGRGQMGTR